MSLERELAELDAALRLPTVGQLTPEHEIDELANLIAKYPHEAQLLLGQQNRANR